LQVEWIVGHGAPKRQGGWAACKHPSTLNLGA
jgi:hypothetical protein